MKIYVLRKTNFEDFVTECNVSKSLECLQKTMNEEYHSYVDCYDEEDIADANESEMYCECRGYDLWVRWEIDEFETDKL